VSLTAAALLPACGANELNAAQTRSTRTPTNASRHRGVNYRDHRIYTGDPRTTQSEVD
jgi:hypothetical protein